MEVVKNPMHDYIARATSLDGTIRAFAARTTGLVEEARTRHRTSPTATATLGRLLTAAAMMGVELVGHESITLRVLGDGPLGAIVAVANPHGKVKGYVQEPQVDLPTRVPGKLNVGGAVGGGILCVTKDMGLKEPYTGTSPLVTGEIGDDLAQYFLTSEQKPSAVALGVLIDRDHSVRAAGGYMIQLLPSAGEAVAQELENNVQNSGPISNLIDQGLTPEDILKKVLTGFQLRIHRPHELAFSCDCSRDRLERVLCGMGKGELKEMAEEGGAELKCHFCCETYTFTAEELHHLINAD
ncbi:MAG: Hsp33 family molecular chaperone HslO [Bacillota bacterium]